MIGRKKDVDEELATHTWPGKKVVVEGDLEWGKIRDEIKDGSLMEVDQTQTDPPWGLDRIDDVSGLDKDYSPGRTGEGTHVYVLDTGVHTTHTDFGGRAIPTLEAL